VPALYFYHPDHLGSTAMVTDLDGHITQNVVYIPFGEVFVEERNGSWASPYLFNAKELDEETGLYYYGARYLNPSIALWLSTDPLQGKHPGMSPYNYCAGNPVKLVDPDGEDWILAKGSSVIWYSGQYGDTRKILHKYKASSGFHDILWGDFRYAYDQYRKDQGPTVEGRYELRFSKNIESKAKTVNGELDLGGIGIETLENLPGMNPVTNEKIIESWGKHRIRLYPINVKQPKNPETGNPSDRNLDSFYFHDSKKGYTHGCEEVETKFFDDLKEFLKKNPNIKRMDVKVKYDNQNQSTYGETDK